MERSKLEALVTAAGGTWLEVGATSFSMPCLIEGIAISQNLP